jgi:hypothetical protein
MSQTQPWPWMRVIAATSLQAEVWIRIDAVAAYGDSPNTGLGNSWILLNGRGDPLNLMDSVDDLTKWIGNTTPVVKPVKT